MDWILFWSASGVVVTLFGILATLITRGFSYVRSDIQAVDKRLQELESRITVVETVLVMMGMPIKEKK